MFGDEEDIIPKVLNKYFPDDSCNPVEPDKEENVYEANASKNGNILYIKFTEDMQFSIMSILKSELLLEEDYNLLEGSSSVVEVENKFGFTKILSSIFPIIGALSFDVYLENILYKLFFTTVSCVPLGYFLYQNYKSYKHKSDITKLLDSLKRLYTIIKKVLKTFRNYEMVVLSAGKEKSFARTFQYCDAKKQVVDVLIELIKKLNFNSSKICINISQDLTENNPTKSVFDPKDLLSNVSRENTNPDISLLYSVYLLCQSEFLKYLGLCYCPRLWTDNFYSNISNLERTVLSDVYKHVTKADRNMNSVLRTFKMFNSKTNERKPVKMLPYHDICESLNFASIYLQTSFENVTQTIESLEQSDLDNLERVFDVGISNLEQAMNDLDAAKDIIEASKIKINKLKKPKTENLPLYSNLTLSNELQPLLKQVNLEDVENDTLADEIFEMFIRDTGDIDAKDCSNDAPDSEHFKKTSKTVLYELKKVLVNKKEEWKKRELAAKKTNVGLNSDINKLKKNLNESDSDDSNSDKDSSESNVTEDTCSTKRRYRGEELAVNIPTGLVGFGIPVGLHNRCLQAEESFTGSGEQLNTDNDSDDSDSDN